VSLWSLEHISVRREGGGSMFCRRKLSGSKKQQRSEEDQGHLISAKEEIPSI